MAGNDVKTVRKISGLSENEMNSDGPYSKVIVQLEKVYDRPDTGIKSQRCWSASRYNCSAVALYCCFILCYSGFKF